jgi:hypothetical protein
MIERKENESMSVDGLIAKWGGLEGQSAMALLGKKILQPMAVGDITAAEARNRAAELKENLIEVFTAETVSEYERERLSREFREVSTYLDGMRHGLRLASELLLEEIK